MVALLALFMLGACQDLFDNPLITRNPNSPEDASIDKVMTGGLSGLALLSEDTDIRIPMLWVGHLTGLSRQHLGFAEYIASATTFGFGDPYNVVAQMRIVQTKAVELNTSRIAGAAQVVEALIIAKQASLYGDIPYTEALDVEKFPKPKYDKMSDVYASLQTTLSTAIANLSKPVLPDGGTITGDFIYGGDAAKWIAAANSLKARLALHVGDYPNAIVFASAGITSSADDMLIPHGDSYAVDQNLHNVFFDINRPADTGCESPTVLPGLMEAREGRDRLWNHFFQDPGIYTGNTDPNTVDGYFQLNSPQPVITFMENRLIVAEANARLAAPNLPNAMAALNEVRAELMTGDIYGQTMPSGTLNYIPLLLIDPLYDTQTELLEEILTTKYILMFGMLEVWNDLRRCQTALPIVQVMNIAGTLPIASDPIVSTTTGRIPDRFIYPQNQINTNGANLPAGGTTIYGKLEIWQ